MTYGDFFICWHHRHFLSSPTPPPGSKLFCFFLPLALRVFQTSNTWLKISRDDCYAGYWHDVRQPSDRRSDTRLNTSSNLDFESVLAKTQKFRSSVFTLPRNQTETLATQATNIDSLYGYPVQWRRLRRVFSIKSLVIQAKSSQIKNCFSW